MKNQEGRMHDLVVCPVSGIACRSIICGPAVGCQIERRAEWARRPRVLVEDLRNLVWDAMGDEAADRIEALEAEIEQLKKLDTYEVGYRDGESSKAADIDCATFERIEALETALRHYAEAECNGCNVCDIDQSIARAVLPPKAASPILEFCEAAELPHLANIISVLSEESDATENKSGADLSTNGAP